MYRVLLAAAAVTAALSLTCQAGGYYDGDYAVEPDYRQHARRAPAHRRPVPKYHLGVGGMIIVHEPYGAELYERAVRTRDPIIWGR
jgi:hypothetical protein